MIVLLAAVVVSAPINVGLAAQLVHPPQIVARSDGDRLGYELHLASYLRRPIRLIAIEVRDADSGRIVARVEGPALNVLAGGQWVPDDTVARTTIAPGGRIVLFLDPLLAGPAPRRIAHRIVYASGDAAPVTIDTAAVAIVQPTKVDLGPPLRGGPWAAVYAPEMEFGHRRYIYAIDGVPRVQGRFAVDFFRAGRIGAKPDRYDADPGFGAEVLAVADATVVAVRDDVADPAGPADKPSPRVEDGAGNFIALRLSDGRHIFYEHLRRGVRVKPGDRVRRGQVIGALDATGHVGGPHLHFHMSDGPDALRGEGLAYRFVTFEQVGSYASIGDFDAGKPWAETAAKRFDQRFPAPNIVVRFADG